MALRPPLMPRTSNVSDDSFRFRHPVTVRYRDIDVGGHAHHSESLMYFEEARWAYWAEVVGSGALSEAHYVMAEATVRWRKRVLWPQTLSVGVRVTRVGRKHFEMEYEVLGEDGETLISGVTTQVMYDYQTGRTVLVPEELGAALALFDGPFD